MTENVCPECEGRIPTIEVGRHDPGEIVVCPDCGVELELLTLFPQATFALAPMEQEDFGE